VSGPIRLLVRIKPAKGGRRRGEKKGGGRGKGVGRHWNRFNRLSATLETLHQLKVFREKKRERKGGEKNHPALFPSGSSPILQQRGKGRKKGGEGKRKGGGTKGAGCQLFHSLHMGK